MGIWDSSNGPIEAEIVTDKPIVATAETKAEVKPIPTGKPEFKGLPVRCGGDRIFLLKGGKKHWIRNAEVFSKLGFKFGDEREIDFDTLQLIPEGTPISE